MNKTSLKILFLTLTLLLILPDAFAWVSIQLDPAYLPADGESKVTITVTVIGPGDPKATPPIPAGPRAGDIISFTIEQGEGTIDPVTTTTDINGQAFTTFTAGTKPEVVVIRATDTTVGQFAHGFVTAFKVEIKASDKISAPPKFIALNGTSSYYARTLPMPLAGDFKWSIIKKKNAEIQGSIASQSVALKGITTSKKADDTGLKVMFKPTMAQDYDVDMLDVTVVGVGINDIVRVPPTKTKTVTVTVSPSLTGSGVDMQLDIIRTTGSFGSAAVNPTSITKTTAVTITGGEQTNVDNPDNLSLRARIGETVFASEAFTVCAHPINFHQTTGQNAGNGILYFEYAWNSDSGNTADLDGVDVGEYVTYPGGNPFIPPNPPFDNWVFTNPKISNVKGDNAGGMLSDTHYVVGGFSTPYVNESFSATQIYRFHCNRDMTPEQWQLLEGPISIDREVTNSSGTWKYAIQKSGVSASIDLP